VKREITKILIANRGEIAVRIIRAARELGIATVAVYSDVDRDSAHVALADEAIALGDPQPAKSYLNAEKLFAAATETGADAIHPGFGFFSENADFAISCEKAGLLWIGPNPRAIDMMGDKLAARETMKKAGVPIVPGSDGAVRTKEEALSWAKKIGFPVLLKASAGGGGKGMRIVRAQGDVESAFENTRREAASYFGDDSVFIEKFVDDPHHIEVQILGDKHGNVVHLFERECSIQRRHQKVIEEAPSPFLLGHDDVRNRLFQVALEGARNINYDSVGTMEFIVDGERNFYFLEMNTRIQVEHPVTELITGIDLVKEQIRVAMGEKISFTQGELVARGAAIECRLYAEDPKSFLPTPGWVHDSWFPGGPFVRVETAIMSHSKIPLDYDPMIAKICSWGRDRAEAIARMQRALSETLIAGSITNIAFLRATLAHPRFQKGDTTTKFIEEEQKSLSIEPEHEVLCEAISIAMREDQRRRSLEPAKPAPWTERIRS
jgi:acetyl-CoA carboxylase biotin carboxylase subunit